MLIDDWDKDCKLPAVFLKAWGDRYEFRAETKGSSLTIRPKAIVVTSNWSIRDCFPERQDYEAIERRFRVIHGAPNPRDIEIL